MAVIERDDRDNIIDGTSSADLIYAYGGDDDAAGFEGNDTIYGGAGNDTLYGGSGNDDLFGGSGINDLYGGSGYDWFRMTSRAVGPSDDLILDFQFDQDRVDLRGWGVSDFDQVRALMETTANDSTLLNAYHNGYDHFLEIDATQANEFVAADFIFSNPGAGTFNGTNYDDVLFGSRGHDTLNGNNGHDILLGGRGNDDLFGGSGNDELWGGLGIDHMTGGSGYDIFAFLSAADLNNPGGARDRILDFQLDVDVIDVSRIDADSTHAGNQDFAWIGRGAFTAPGQLRYEYTGGGTITLISANTDADAAPEFRLELSGHYQLIAGDFVL
ncbi:MAG: M10 family metallopeptidase C-terminal domain-containing protein [Alphaproteobacteria bacterium]|nr:M10 family metallopeptidase C-terminal domain-containing protein [Alphaproteobacteria bacterium]